jgi:putative oxidoreductase
MDKTQAIQNTVVDQVILLASRLLLAWIFVHEGAFLGANFAAASASVAKIGVPTIALVGTIGLQFVAGIAIAVGWHACLGAAALGLFCLATAIFVSHKFGQSKRAAVFREGPRHRWRIACIDAARPGRIFSSSIRRRKRRA